MALKSVTAARKVAVLEHLRQIPSIRSAARAAGVSHSIILRWAQIDAVFSAKMESAIAAGVGRLEDAAFSRAIDGVEEPVIAFGNVVRDGNGNVVMLRKYSDTLALRLLQAHGGPAYRDKSSVDLRVGLNPDDLTDEQLAAIAAGGRKPPAGTSES